MKLLPSEEEPLTDGGYLEAFLNLSTTVVDSQVPILKRWNTYFHFDVLNSCVFRDRDSSFLILACLTKPFRLTCPIFIRVCGGGSMICQCFRLLSVEQLYYYVCARPFRFPEYFTLV